MTSRREDLAWAAGLFEGEGCLNFKRETSKPSFCGIRANLASTDADTASRFAAIVGVGKLRVQKPYGLGTKEVYYWSIHSFENVQYLIALFWCWLGERRRNKAKELLAIMRVYHASGLPRVGVIHPRRKRANEKIK